MYKLPLMRWSLFVLALAVTLVFGNANATNAKPWDLIISAKFEQAQVEIGQNPILIGTVVDQKGSPVQDVDVKIRFVGESVTTKTDKDGKFQYEFSIPKEGMFDANISASIKNLKGMGKATIKIGNGITTSGDLYYDSDFERTIKNDAYKSLKQKQYQKYIEAKNNRLEKLSESAAKKLIIEEKRSISEQKKLSDINKTKPGEGVYSTEKQEQYITKIDPRIRNMTKTQMEYTRQIHEQAKYVMNRTLENGGTVKEAKKAYFEKLATTHDSAQAVGNTNNTESHSKIVKHDTTKNKKVRGLTYSKYFK